jgi:hypothetical protein
MARKSYVPDILAPRYALRVSDFGADHVLHVRCEACARVVLIDAAELRRSFEPCQRIVVLAERLRCTRCAAPTPLSWSVYRKVAPPEA